MPLAMVVKAGALASSVLALSLPLSPAAQPPALSRASVGGDAQLITVRRLESLDRAFASYLDYHGILPRIERAAAIEALLAPTFVIMVPEADAWGTPFQAQAGGNRWMIVSAGPNRQFERDWHSCGLDCALTPTTDDLLFPSDRSPRQNAKN